MRKGESIHKVIGGKLLRVSVTEDDDGNISSFTVMGDFFMHPESALEDLEKAVRKAGHDRRAREKAVEDFFSRDDMVMYGAGAKDMIEAVDKAFDGLSPS